MTVGDMLGGGVRLVRTHPKALALWGLLYLAAIGVMMVMLWPMMTGMAAFQQRAMTAGPDGLSAAPPAELFNFMGGVFLMELVLLVVIVAIFAAAVRATAHGGDDRFGFLRLGMDELRLFGVGILLWLLLVVAILLFSIVAALLAGALSAAMGDGAATVVIVVLWIAAPLLLIWAEVRISLAGAFTVLRGRITIRPAWRATRGKFWTLLGAYLLIGLVYVVVSVLLTAIFFPDLFRLYATMFTTTDPAAIIAAQSAMMGSLFGPRMLASLLVGTVVNTVLAGWLFGAVATAAVTLDQSEAARA